MFCFVEIWVLADILPFIYVRLALIEVLTFNTSANWRLLGNIQSVLTDRAFDGFGYSRHPGMFAPGACD
jgi:hypothetical protein